MGAWLQTLLRKADRRLAASIKLLCGGRIISYMRVLGGLAREWAWVVSGLSRMQRQDPEAVVYRLRRNLHRVEKALAVPQRRQSFALKYINQTVDDLAAVLGQLSSGHPEYQADVQWAVDVLGEYFSVVTEDGNTGAARRQFQQLCQMHNLTASGPVTAPIGDICKRAADLRPGTSGMDYLRSLAETRKSVRWFRPDKVDRTLIDRCLDVARLAPSGCNRQPLHYVVIDDPDRATECASLLIGTGGMSAKIPAMVVIAGRWRAFEHPRDRHLPYIDGGLSAMLFLLALETQGLAGCCVNCPDMGRVTADLSRFLSLEKDEKPILAIVLGYPLPDAVAGRADRRSLEALRSLADTCS